MLLELPELCMREIARYLAQMARDGSAVSLVATSREVHSAYSSHFYDAVDPGCVHGMAEIRAVHRSGVSYVQAVANNGVQAGTPQEWSAALRLAELRGLCAARRIATSGSKAMLLARLAENHAQAMDMTRAKAAAAERVLSDPALCSEPSELACAVRRLVRRACRARRRDGTGNGVLVTASDATRHHGLPHEVLAQLPSDRGGLYRKHVVLEAVLALRGPGQLKVADPAAQMDAAAGRIYGELRRERVRALLAGCGVDQHVVEISRLSQQPITRYVRGSGTEEAVVRLARRALEVLDGRRRRKDEIATALAELGLAGGADRLMERAMPGTTHALSLYEDSGEVYAPWAHVSMRPGGDNHLAGAQLLVQAAVDAVRRLREVMASLEAEGDPEPVSDDELGGSVGEFVVHARGDATTAARILRERRFLKQHVFRPGSRAVLLSGQSASLLSWIVRRGGLRAALQAPELPASLQGHVRSAACYGDIARMALTEARLANLSDREVHQHILAVISTVSASPPVVSVAYQQSPCETDLLHGAIADLVRPRLAAILRRQARQAFIRLLPSDWFSSNTLIVAFDNHMASVPGWIHPSSGGGEWCSPAGRPAWLAPFSTDDIARLARVALAGLDAARLHAEEAYVDAALVVPDAVAASLSCADERSANDAARGIIQALLAKDASAAIVGERRRNEHRRVVEAVASSLGAETVVRPAVDAVLRACSRRSDDVSMWRQVVAAVASSDGRLLPCAVYGVRIVRSAAGLVSLSCLREAMDAVDASCDQAMMRALVERGTALDSQPVATAVEAARSWGSAETTAVLYRLRALLVHDGTAAAMLMCPLCPTSPRRFCIQGICAHLESVHRAVHAPRR